MKKEVAERCDRISIFWLKQNSFLNGYTRYGSIQWTYGNNKPTYTTFCITADNGMCGGISLQHMSAREYQMVHLTTTRCHFGGKRYWFVCHLFRHGRYCGRRVGVLFYVGDAFGCRYCSSIAYRSQNRGGKHRGSSVTALSLMDAENAIKRFKYAGNVTRKFRRFILLHEKFERDLMRIGVHFQEQEDKFTSRKKMI